MEPLALKVADVAALLAISKAKAYALIKRGDIPSVTVGKSVRVPRRALEAWIDENTRRAG